MCDVIFFEKAILGDLVIPENIAHPEWMNDCAKCRDCGRTVHDFHIPNEIWNHVMTGSPIIRNKDGSKSKEGAGGVLCYDCFCERASKKGYVAVFKCELIHHNEVSERVYIEAADQ